MKDELCKKYEEDLAMIREQMKMTEGASQFDYEVSGRMKEV